MSVIVTRGFNEDLIIVEDSNKYYIDEKIYVYAPNWFERLVGITWEQKVNEAKQKFKDREETIKKCTN